MKLKFLFIVALIVFSSEEGRTQNTSDRVQKSLTEGHFSTSNEHWRINSEHRSSTSGVYHIYFQQLVSGIPVKGTESSLHLSATNTVINENIQFVATEKLVLTNESPYVISPQKAVEAVARQMGYSVTEAIEVVEKEKYIFDEIWLTNGGISEREIKAQLIYTVNKKNTYDLAWEIDVLQPDYLHWWVFEVNAENGLILNKEDRMKTCYRHDHSDDTLDYNKNLFDIENYKPEETVAATACDECYEVFALPLESPYYGDRTIIENPAHPIASPFGWHDIDGEPGAEFTSTLGNNVNAFEANFVFGYHPDGGSTLDFTGYDFDPEYSVNTPYIDASITNLFYWTNILHDITYQYGFDEVAGNFQVNNYLRGGSGGDSVVAHGQSIDRPCNASFSTQEDGVSPLMVMNVCSDKDGDFDSTVLAHEYAHGVIARLTGGAVIANCFRHAENPAEGWCDWLGVLLTIKPEDTGATPRSVANYLTGQGPAGGGIRPYPYSTDMNVNPHTYADLPSQIGVHKVGAVWGEMLWEVTWTLIDRYGFDPDIYNFTGELSQDAGNIMAMAIVTEGLKFTQCQPGFVEARDALLLATEQIYGAEVVCEIWPAFARRGLGFIADQGNSDIKGDERISFRNPWDGPIFEAEYEEFCFSGGVYESLSGGLPLGGTYSGPGVIDNADGATFNFDPAMAGIGIHTVTYHFPETICAPAFDVFKDDLVVFEDLTIPVINCLADVRVVIELEESYFLADFTDYNTVSDTCPGNVSVTQNPPIGTLLEIGETEITLTASDTAGNEATCSFILRLVYVSTNDDGDPREFLTFFPNPGREFITIVNTFQRRIETIEIRDMQGRLVDQFDIYNSEVTNEISVEVLSSGSYFITLKFPEDNVVMRLLKR